MSASVVINTGVVCVGARDGARNARSAVAYVECAAGRAVWLEGDAERATASDAPTALFAVVDAEGADAVARPVASAVARVIARLHPAGAPRDPGTVLTRYLVQVHTRMSWAVSAGAPPPQGASVAVAWICGASLAWAELGRCALWRLRRNGIERLSAPWPQAASQRLVAGSRNLGDDALVHFAAGRNHGVAPVADGDRYVLITGGVGERIGAPALAQLLRSTDGAQDIAVAVADRARAIGEDGPISVIVAVVALPARDEDDDNEPTVEVVRAASSQP